MSTLRLRFPGQFPVYVSKQQVLIPHERFIKYNNYYTHNTSTYSVPRQQTDKYTAASEQSSADSDVQRS